MSIDETTELDHFGPWIDPVAAPADVPALFRPHPIDFARVRMALKVPRNLARRDARAGMDLYDHLVLLEDSLLTVLTRSGSSFTTTTTKLANIVVIVESTDLLDGKLSVINRDDSRLVLPFNGSSRKVITQLVDELRPSRASQGPAVTSAGLTPRSLGAQSAGIAAAFNELVAIEPQTALLATQAEQPLRVAVGGFTGLQLRLRPERLQAAVYARNEHELIVLGRREATQRTREPSVSASRTVVRLNEITTVTVAPHRYYAHISDVTLTCGEARIALTTPTNSDAEKALRRLAQQ